MMLGGSGNVIIVSGTPGVGKTAVALELSRILKAKYINLTEYVIANKLYTHYDRDTDSFVIDEDALRTSLRELIDDGGGLFIIDSHYGEIVEEKYVKKVVVLRLDPRHLYIRLRSRGWLGRKLIDNVESELLSICTANALREYGSSKVCEVDVTNKTLSDVVTEVLDILDGRRECRVYVDWLRYDDIVDEVLKLLPTNDEAPLHPNSNDIT